MQLTEPAAPPDQHRDVSRSARRWPAVAALAALILGAGSGALWLQREPDSVSVDSPVPDGKQLVSFRGVEVMVPDTWPIDRQQCGVPVADTVVVEDGGPTSTCLSLEPPGLTVVTLLPLDDSRASTYGFAQTVTTVDGKPGRRGSKPYGTSHLEALVLPDPGVIVAAYSPDPARALALVETTHIVDIDHAGCRARGELAARMDDPGAAESLVPGQPSRGGICVYDAGSLERSHALTGDELRQLVQTLNRLPAGATSALSGTLPSRCGELKQHGFVLKFEYADGAGGSVVVRISDCEQLTATNGTRTTGIHPDLTKFLLDRVGYDDVFDRAAVSP